MSEAGRERPDFDGDAADSSRPVAAEPAVAPGCDPSGLPAVEDPFVTFTEWGDPVDEADYAGL